MFENNEYVSYHFEPDGSEPNDSPRNDFHSAPSGPEPEKPKKKKHGGAKLVAVALSCAILGGVGGGAIVSSQFSAKLNQITAAQAVQTSAAGSKASAVVTNVVQHTNTGDKDLTPQEVYNKYVDTVVGITTSGVTTNVFGQETEFAASGSGFIISGDGYIVTNNHVIADATSVKVALHSGKTYDAKVIGGDASNDVALLKIEATGLPTAAIGDSDSIAVGDQVAAIGNPLGELTYSLTVGYVSALDREINADGTPINMLQTDAAINSGNSGGPLFDMNGNVIGITSAKYSGSTSTGTSIEGIGFAIPINDAISIVNDLKTYGYVTGQAYLGISVKDLDTTTAQYYSLPAGCYVASVADGSCSAKSGLKNGDIITALNDTAVASYTDLVGALKQHKAGETITLKIYRAGQTLSLKVKLDEKQPEKTKAPAPGSQNGTQQNGQNSQNQQGSQGQQSGQQQSGQQQSGSGSEQDPFGEFFNNFFNGQNG